MREIKFSCMWFDGVIWMDLRYTLAELENGEHWDALADHPSLRKFKLKHRRQFTGLTDRNGDEIYEGDIIKAKLITDTGVIENHIGHVLFEDFEYAVETADSSWPIASWKCVESCEVIGNIYTTPELFEESTQ